MARLTWWLHYATAHILLFFLNYSIVVLYRGVDRTDKYMREHRKLLINWTRKLLLHQGRKNIIAFLIYMIFFTWLLTLVVHLIRSLGSRSSFENYWQFNWKWLAVHLKIMAVHLKIIGNSFENYWQFIWKLLAVHLKILIFNDLKIHQNYTVIKYTMGLIIDLKYFHVDSIFYIWTLLSLWWKFYKI